MSVETIARRYASALADVVVKSGETETVKRELQAWDEIFKSNSELENVFASPAIAHPDKEKVLDSLIAKANPSKTTANFLRLLLRNGRLTDLGEIATRFAVVLEERSGTVLAQITSARELSDPHKNELRSNLERFTGKQVKLNFDINNDIIGGVIARVGSTVYDGSVKTQLENLREELING